MRSYSDVHDNKLLTSKHIVGYQTLISTGTRTIQNDSETPRTPQIAAAEIIVGSHTVPVPTLRGFESC